MLVSDFSKPLILQSDFSLLLDVHNPLSGNAAGEIAAFAELEKSPEHIHTYRMTPLSLWNAASAGLTTEKILDALHRFSRFPVPQSIRVYIESTISKFGKVVLTDSPFEKKLELKTDDEKVRLELFSRKTIAPLLEEKAGKIYISLLDRGRIKQELINIGYPVEENLQVIPRLEGVPPQETARRTAGLLEAAGLEPEAFLFRYPGQLTEDQRQRIALARAFAGNPELVLMDEPFSHLDPIARSRLQDEVVALQSRLCKTIVLVTHDMDEAIKIAHRICIMNRGRVVQYDTPENILKYPADDVVRDFVGRKRIWSSPELIRARDIMLTAPITAPAEMGFLRAAEVMRMNKVDSLLVVDSRHRFLGIVSMKELRRRADQGLATEENTPLRQLMNPNPPCCRPEDSIVSLMKTVNRADLSTLPVVDQEGVLRGLITKGSLVSTLSQQFTAEEGGVRP